MDIKDTNIKSEIKEVKPKFESPVIEIMTFVTDDIMAISGGFLGDDDPIILPKDIF